ncbi:MAG: hypothetical protein ACQEQJ_09455 [Halobacteriota archaeon]
MPNPHVVTNDDGELEYVEHHIDCNNTVVRLFPDEDADGGWRVEEDVADEDGPWSKP